MATTFPTTVDTATQLYTAVNGVATTLNGAIDNAVTTITVMDTTNFPSVGYIVIDTEVIKYTGKTISTFTGCTRSADGSAAAAHATAAAVNAYIVADHHNVLMNAIIAVEADISARLGIGASSNAIVVPSGVSVTINSTGGVILGAGVFKVPVGSVTAPSINFGTANSGIYGTFSTHISFASNGVEVMDIQPTTIAILASGGISNVAGSVSAVAYTFTPGSQNDGMYQPASGQVALAAAGVQILLGKSTGCSIRGTTTNDSASAGFVGEYIQTIQTTPTSFPSTGTYGDLVSLTLTAGDWDISMIIEQIVNGATITGWNAGIGTASGTSTTGISEGENSVSQAPATATANVSITIPPFRVSISGSTTYYLKYRANYSVSTPTAVGRISARRVR